MRCSFESLDIVLESAEEIKDFWNIIMFALDLHSERTQKQESCMNESELKLAKKLVDITAESWK